MVLVLLQISDASVEETLTGEVVLSVLKVTVNKPALYTCLASNRHTAGANTVKATASVTVAGTSLTPGHQCRGDVTLMSVCVCVRSGGAGSISFVWPQLFAARQPPFGENLQHTHRSWLTTHTLFLSVLSVHHDARVLLRPETHSASSLLPFPPLGRSSTIVSWVLPLPRRVEVREPTQLSV